MFNIKELKKVCIIGMGLLGSSVTMSAMRAFPKVSIVGFSHRESTRKKARQLHVANAIAETLEEAVNGADMVILATPVMTFEAYFRQISPFLKKGCIVTDVGSTKALVHKWAARRLPKNVYFVGSHPIAGSEKRGIEFARDDLLTSARCILTQTSKTNKKVVKLLAGFWTALGCNVLTLSPTRHDQIYGLVSHLPHITAAALVNASSLEDMKYAGKGFIDTSRVASGPADVWADILLTNNGNVIRGIDRLTTQLGILRKAVQIKNVRGITQLLEKASIKRGALIAYKLKKRELI